MTNLTQADFEALDRQDPLAKMRDLFVLPDGHVYADGNSLGALPKAAPAVTQNVVQQQWGQSLVRGWNSHDWVHSASRIGDKIASFIGADSGEVLVCDSTSVNLFKLAFAAMRMSPGRTRIVTEAGSFPTDLYMLQGLIEFSRGEIELLALPREQILSAVDETTAVVVLTHVHYKTGERFDMNTITAAVQERGALMLWDLCHTAGAMPVDLNDDNVDLAVGCGYKYLNGGPGAPAFLYVAKRHQDQMRSPLPGWFGHAAPFAFRDDYEPAEGIRRMMCGTPSVLGSSVLEVGVDILASVDMNQIREKSVRMTDLLMQLFEQRCPEFRIITPRDPDLRGSHVSITHEQGHAIMQALIANHVIGDFRTPDALRFGVTPLYMRYADLWTLVDTLVDIMKSRTWDRDEFKRVPDVT